ncbi:hypothetical protein EJ04DRAFT_164736 [Polyplosphaeria fusca]|uniref:Uncharacterized protein n=1 Tax=Polyplosphaeria fusca TaxID=682080 RepID=A0A9P4R872_9PLEO|nr:hypothetical protein EJ04DRAFT_164736 [Polyplosphaeria fusca]
MSIFEDIILRKSEGVKTILIILLSFTTVLLAIPHLIKKDLLSVRLSQNDATDYSTVWKPYIMRSPYVDSNSTIADAHWESLDLDRGWIAMSHSYAIERGMLAGLPLPDDPEKGLFVLDGYHQMHCLMTLRTDMYAMLRGEHPPHPESHWRHCFNLIRQAIQCHADDTPLSHLEASLRPCQSWAKMDQWLAAHDTCWRGDNGQWARKKSCM